MIDLRNGDCIEVMKGMADNSVDSIVTDPPYELGFMGKSWDSTGIANNVDMWRECLRVLKPGGYLLSFSATRTYHRMAVAIEDAGFEIRDMIEWVYGSGFPKSLNIGKAVDKLQGNEREVVGSDRSGSSSRAYQSEEQTTAGEYKIDKGNSEYEGWGTALKPAHEPICMARKPISEKTVAENCLKWGTGGINIDKSRVGTEEITTQGGDKFKGDGIYNKYATCKETTHTGRFPANLIHDGSDEVAACFPETKSGKATVGTGKGFAENASGIASTGIITSCFADSGNASRFFKSIIYQPKASKAERNKGCEGLEEKQYSHDGRDKEIENPYQRNKSVATNNHPTVKPVKLMEYLIEMVTPENGTVLDPFLGSGTTGVAAANLNRKFIGIELDKDYFAICEKRVNDAVIEKQQNLF